MINYECPKDFTHKCFVSVTKKPLQTVSQLGEGLLMLARVQGAHDEGELWTGQSRNSKVEKEALKLLVEDGENDAT